MIRLAPTFDKAFLDLMRRAVGALTIAKIRPLAYTEEFEAVVQQAYGGRDVATCKHAWELLVQTAKGESVS